LNNIHAFLSYVSSHEMCQGVNLNISFLNQRGFFMKMYYKIKYCDMNKESNLRIGKKPLTDHLNYKK
jgi:hypothetical protein